MTTYDTLVIGAGQCGLAAGYHLARAGHRFVILEGESEIGHTWSSAWDSLRLFSPARNDALPGLPFPAPPMHFPTRDEVLAYVRDYAAHFDLPVRTGVRVESLRADGGRLVATADGERYEAANVVVATGGHQVPYTPSFAADLAPGIVQHHSTTYRRPSDLPPGDVLVVGASHSGADIALEVAATHHTLLSGTIHGQVPFRLDGPEARVVTAIWPFVTRHVLTVRTPMGRRLRTAVRGHGAPLMRVRRSHLLTAGVELVPRVTGVDDGLPVVGGSAARVRSVIWCTGYRPDYSWIEVDGVVDAQGYPITDRGAGTHPGLYFLGVPFQDSFSSMLLGGAGAEAERVVRHLAARPVAVA